LTTAADNSYFIGIALIVHELARAMYAAQCTAPEYYQLMPISCHVWL